MQKAVAWSAAPGSVREAALEGRECLGARLVVPWVSAGNPGWGLAQGSGERLVCCLKSEQAEEKVWEAEDRCKGIFPGA